VHYHSSARGEEMKMSDDNKLLELAAKAAGIKGKYYVGNLNDEWVDGIVYIREDGQQCVWNPLTDDGDALRLAVRLKLQPFIGDVTVTFVLGDTIVTERIIDDPYTATRRAIVRAAAKIGECVK
jgi:hypothetical protein